jgi:NAD(P)-dependent dehydrogenase (short-subunit alcohol dehydrogenase family)
MGHFLIIGASSGIGQTLANQLAEEGHQVYGTYFTHKPDLAISNNLQFFPYNVMDEKNSLEFLPDTLDGLVYCPGSIVLKPFERISLEEFSKEYQLHVLGAIKVLQQVLPKLKKSNQASVVMFSTVAVSSGFPYHTQIGASKGAVEGLVKSLAAEYAPKIRVNAIAPSLIDSPLAASLLSTDAKKEANALRHPLKRIGNTTDIAHMAAFLLSEKSSWITGQIMHVDGGMSTLKV